MRSSIDLLDLPYTYWQLPLLTEADFCREAKARGLHLREHHLEDFHRLRLLIPFLRVRRDGRAIAAAARRRDPDVWQAAHWEPTSRRDLLEARAAGRLHDPAAEHFIARRRLQREVGEISYRSSEYLYSHHQLLGLSALKDALPYLRPSAEGGEVGFGDVHPAFSGFWRSRAEWLRPQAIAISALEPIYYSRIVGRIRYDFEELEPFEDWRRKLKPEAILDWLEVDAEWVRESARNLLALADQIDPLGRWLEVVREADPPRWELLQGEARSAIDLRIGAEVLMRYYDRLARDHLAPKIEPPGRRERDDFSGRLRPVGGLDRTLTEFGLSPHPRLILVVEGETELFIFPRLMDFFGIRRDRDYIAIESTQGVDKNIAALVAYAVAPQTERDEHDRYLRLNKPLTRLLAVMDAEKKLATAEGRKKRREAWIKRILDTLPPADRTRLSRNRSSGWSHLLIPGTARGRASSSRTSPIGSWRERSIRSIGGGMRLHSKSESRSWARSAPGMGTSRTRLGGPQSSSLRRRFGQSSKARWSAPNGGKRSGTSRLCECWIRPLIWPASFLNGMS